MQEHGQVSPAQLSYEQVTARIKEMHRLIAEHQQEIARLERELHLYEREQLARAPRGTYRHRREGGSEITVEAVVLETDGDAKRIQYQIPPRQARRGEEDAYIRWLRSSDELARFTQGERR
jgi:hypothetical protein